MLDFKLIIWDFDGVIIFSNAVREEGFREIFKSYDPVLTDRLLEYHRGNGGLSRYVKIRYFFEELLRESISDDQVKVLAEEFSQVQKKRLVDKKLLNTDWLDFMQQQGSQYVHHIASGSDGTELRGLCDALGISHHFVTINGSPTPKNQLVSEIIERESFDKSDIVLIGDAGNDYEAATVNEISFRGYNNEELKGKGEYITQFVKLVS